MKRILNKLMCAILLPLSALAVSCTESDNWEPGAPDVTGCYDVFFPEQENTGNLEVDPEDALTFTYTAHRGNAEGSIVVPVVISSNTDGLYTVSPIEFADGEDVTSFTVTLSSESEISKKYTLEIDIVDPQYTPQYTMEHNNSLLLSVTRVKWTEEASGTFISEFWADGNGNANEQACKLYRKNDSSHFKITNFLGLGTDFFFEWNETSNLCQLDGWVYTGFDYQGSMKSYLMDGIGFYNEWLGENYGWEVLEQNGHPQPYYDPDKKAFFFHVYGGVPDAGEGMGFGWTDEVFLLEGGSLGCELSLALTPVSEMFKPEFAAQYPDDSHLGYMIQGVNLTELKFSLLPTEVYNDAENYLKMTIDEYLDQYGMDASTPDANGDTIFDVMKEYGYYADIAGGLDPDTSYTLFAKATNAGGDSAFEYVSCKTAKKPAPADPNTPIVGSYTMSYSEDTGYFCTNTFTVEASDKENEYLVSNLGKTGTPCVYYGVYDSAAGTFTCDGKMVGYESYGNLFGRMDIYTKQDKSEGFRYWVYDDPQSDSVNDPLVFTVNASTKKLSTLNTNLHLPLISFDSEGKPVTQIGDLAYFPAGTECVLQGAAAASAKPAFRSNVPFSSVCGNKSFAGLSVVKSVNKVNGCNITERADIGKFVKKPVRNNAKLTNAVSKL